MRNNRIVLVLIVMILVVYCSNEDIVAPNNNIKSEFKLELNFINDSTKLPISDVECILNQNTYSSDQNGLVTIDSLKSGSHNLKINHQFYYEKYLNFSLEKDTIITIKLIHRKAKLSLLLLNASNKIPIANLKCSVEKKDYTSSDNGIIEITEIPIGRIEISLSNPNYFDYSDTIMIASDTLISVDLVSKIENDFFPLSEDTQFKYKYKNSYHSDGEGTTDEGQVIWELIESISNVDEIEHKFKSVRSFRRIKDTLNTTNWEIVKDTSFVSDTLYFSIYENLTNYTLRGIPKVTYVYAENSTLPLRYLINYKKDEIRYDLIEGYVVFKRGIGMVEFLTYHYSNTSHLTNLVLIE